MVIVELSDGTKYYIDTDDTFTARYVVEYKLENRLDYRFKNGMKTEIIEDVMIKSNSTYYNSANAHDGQPLKCKTGWSYKWSDGKCAEFR